MLELTPPPPGDTWREIPGMAGWYYITPSGLVWSAFSARHLSIRKPRKSDYLVVTLRVSGRNKQLKIHRLVALAYLGEPTGPVVRHLDGNPKNNHVSNLAYGTQVENGADTIRHGRQHQLLKTHCPHGHPYDEANTYRHGTRRFCRPCNRAACVRYETRKREEMNSNA